jgi:hypothetical protein
MEASSKLIPELEGAIPKLQEQFSEEEKVLEQIKETSRGELAYVVPVHLVTLIDNQAFPLRNCRRD